MYVESGIVDKLFLRLKADVFRSFVQQICSLSVVGHHQQFQYRLIKTFLFHH